MNLNLPKSIKVAALTTLGLVAACQDQPSPAKVESVAESKQIAAIARGKVDVEGGLINLSFATEGMVTKVAVKEGQQVEKGQLLLQQDKRIWDAEKQVALSEMTIADTTLQGLQQQIPELVAKVKRLQLAAEAGAAQMQLKDEAQLALQQLQTEVNTAQAQYKLAKSKVNQINARGALLDVRAPSAGTVVKLSAHAGEVLAAGQEALVLLPQQALIVRAELNESFLSSVKVGMPAKVQVDHDSGRIDLATAHVTRISPIFIHSQLQDNTQQSPGRVVECILEFNAQPITRVGQNVIVSFYDQP
jgi:multidrug resistance efflux pump